MVARAASAQKPPRKRAGVLADSDVEFTSSGCTVLDCLLGAGWPLGRIVNIVGDKAVGKTLLAIEACANFAQTYPKGHIWYREAEAAFDISYARELGLPVDRVDFGPEGTDSSWDTIEDIAEDMEKCAAAAKKSKRPGLYIIDSLDAVSSRAEMDRKAGEGTYGLEKQKELGRIFRKQVRLLRSARVCLIVISQIRDKIGVMFGEKHTRTGGKALDFYASIIVWLHHKATLKSSIKGVERVTGVRVRAKCKKNKVAPSFRECEFVIRFGYGVDDLEASLGWLKEVGRLDRVGIKVKSAKEQDEAIRDMLRAQLRADPETARAKLQGVVAAVRESWAEIDDDFRPQRKKYA